LRAVLQTSIFDLDRPAVSLPSSAMANKESSQAPSASSAPQLCRNGCGFYGAAPHFLCSSCSRRLQSTPGESSTTANDRRAEAALRGRRRVRRPPGRPAARAPPGPARAGAAPAPRGARRRASAERRIFGAFS